jgi:sulfite reductase alpha subunit-like flavoprotein
VKLFAYANENNFYQSLNYEPGDHVGVCPMNKKNLVDGILEKLIGVTDPDEDMQLQILNEKHTSNGKKGGKMLFSNHVKVFIFYVIFEQASLERGRVTKKFQHARCGHC